MSKILYELSLRPDIRADVLNRVMLKLNQKERVDLRALHAIQQEHYIAKRDCIELLERECFNALNSIDLRSCEALSIRLMNRIRERLACDENGNRRVICRPPSYSGIGNPLTRESNRQQGILWEHKAVLVPYVFRNSQQMKRAADLVLEGRTLHLAFDFDGAAWDLWDQARDLFQQLERDGNLLELPAGVLRSLQIIFDGHGWTSRTGAVRFVLRCPQTLRDHNATRNARNPIFALGSDKHAHLERMLAIGEEKGISMSQRLYSGLKVTERQPTEMPAHVQADELFLPLAMIQCARPAHFMWMPCPVGVSCRVGSGRALAVGMLFFRIRVENLFRLGRSTPAQLPPARSVRCDIELEVPTKIPAHPPLAFEFTRVRCTGTGDCAAAHAGGAIDTPVNRKGCCFRCTLEKTDWINEDKCKHARRRNFVYQARPPTMP